MANTIINFKAHSFSYRKQRIDYLNNFRIFCEIINLKYIFKINPRIEDEYKIKRLNDPVKVLNSKRILRTVSTKTVKEELFFLQNFLFEKAIEYKIIDTNPFEKTIKDLKVYRKEKPLFENREITLLIDNTRMNSKGNYI